MLSNCRALRLLAIQDVNEMGAKLILAPTRPHEIGQNQRRARVASPWLARMREDKDLPPTILTHPPLLPRPGVGAPLAPFSTTPNLTRLTTALAALWVNVDIFWCHHMEASPTAFARTFLLSRKSAFGRSVSHIVRVRAEKQMLRSNTTRQIAMM